MPGEIPVNRREPPIPPIDGFEISFQFDHKIKLGVIDVYQTAIQMMYDLAQRPYTQTVQAVDSKQFANYDVLMLFINTQAAAARDQLQARHCVSALWRAIQMMTDGVLFCQNRAFLSVRQTHIGGLSIMPIGPDVTSTNNSSANSTEEDVELAMNSSSDNGVSDWSRGQVKDADNPQITIDYQFLGKTINQKEVSLAVLEALTAAAPYPKFSGCEEIAVSSPDGGCAVVIEGIPSQHHFTYQWATRALKILYQTIVVPQKRFGDVKLDIRYRGEIFGQLRMLKTMGGKNSTELVANVR